MKQVNHARREFLKVLGAAPVAGALGCAQLPMREIRFADKVNVIKSVEGSVVGFNKNDAINNLRVSYLPEMYEHRVLITKQSSHAEAIQAMHELFFKDTEISLIRHGHTTAIVVYQPELRRVTIAFDGTHEAADIMDSVKFFPVKNVLGGKAEMGYQHAVLSTGGKEDPATLSDSLKKKVAGYAEREGIIDVTLTGFSRGGSLAVGTAAEWFATGMPGGDKTRLTDVQTFAGIPYGDQTFVDKFNEAAKRHDTQVTRLAAVADTVPELITMAPYPKYKQAGDQLYLMFNPDTGATDMIVNPSVDALKFARAKLNSQAKAETANYHDLNMYAQLFGAKQAFMQFDVQAAASLPAVQASRAEKILSGREVTVAAQR